MTLYLVTKLSALFGVIVLQMQTNQDTTRTIISALALTCLFLTDMLFSFLKQQKRINTILIISGIAGCFYIGMPDYMPVVVFLFLQLNDVLTEGRFYWEISVVVIVLGMLIFTPDLTGIIISCIMFFIFIPARTALVKLAVSKELVNELRTEIAFNKKKLSDMKGYTKTLRDITIMEERNRFATKIHDELGHGISGSILLLEGARLNLEKNPKQAGKSINIAVENLRRGVDNIRMYLKEERPGALKLGIAEIKSKLEFFKTTYNIDTEIDADGDLNRIPIQVWICIQETLTEALTNIIKHSDATSFTLKLSVHNKIVRAEFCDNGISEGSINKGMGLETIEERTAICQGRCFFKNGKNGFCIVCVFMI